jgi:hypothetical protein
MALHSSSNLVKSSIRESLDYSSEYLWTRRDVCSTSVGNIASDPYTSEKGVYPVARLGVVRRAHSTDNSFFIHFPA